MIKRTFSLLLLVITAAFAAENLVRVELNETRLGPLAQRGLRVLAELETCALVLLDEGETDALSSLESTVLDTDCVHGNYYLVCPMGATLDLTLYGDVLTRDGDDYLLKIREGMLPELIKEKVMVKRLPFTAMVIMSETRTPDLQFRYDPTVQEIVDLVSADSILANVQRMQDFVTRYSNHDSCFAAANWAAQMFTAYGCDTVYLQQHTGGYAPNAVGIRRGTLYPDSIYAVVCGHIDATSYLQPNIAPGADDNGSGVAAAIEALRVMQGYEFEYSIRFIAFTGEEQGLYGSEYYALHARMQNDSILGVLNADMIAYTDIQPESLDVFAKISNPPCEPFADFFIAAADTYTTLLTTKRMTTSMVYSDHSPFWEQGYLALCNIEDFYVTNPYYHQPGDTIGGGYNNNAFCTEVTKAQVAALSILAGVTGTRIDELTAGQPGTIDLDVRPAIGSGLFNISFTTGPSRVVIRDVSGRVVKSIDAPSNQPSERVSISWDGKDDLGQRLSAGIYFVTTDDADALQTRKLILVR